MPILKSADRDPVSERPGGESCGILFAAFAKVTLLFAFCISLDLPFGLTFYLEIQHYQK